MDAAQTLLKKTVLFSALALFVMAAGLHAQPQFNTVGNLQLGLGGGSTNVTSSGDPITFTATLSGYTVPSGDPATWVVFNNGANNITGLTTPSALSFSILNLGATAGTYQATVTLHATNPATGVTNSTFTVTYVSGTSGGGGGGGGTTGTIAATPTSVTLSSNANSTNAVQTTVQLSTTSSSAISFNVTYTPLGTWLQVGTTSSFVTSGSPATLNIVASAFSLSTSQSGTITVTPTNGGTATTIPITFNINGTGGGGGTNGSVTASPNPVSWNYNSNSGIFPSQFAFLQTNTGALTYTANASSNGNWLLANGGTTNVGGTISGGISLSVSGNITNLITGTYQGTVTVLDSSGGSGTITVNLTVNGGSTTGLTLSPSSGLTFAGAVGSGNTSPQTITITSNLAGTLQVNCSSTGWLQCSGIPSNIGQNSGTNITVVANGTSLANGTYNGQFSVTVSGSSQQLQGSVPVTFVVGTGSGGGGGGGGVTGFAVSPSSLVFSYQIGTTRQSVSRQVIGITGPGGAQWMTTPTTASGGQWLNSSTILATFAQDNTSSATISVDPFGLTTGTYTGSVPIVSNGVSQSVSVTLNVITAPILLPNPGAVLFNYHTGDAALQPQTINLSASDGSPITATAATTTSWITVNQTAGATAFSITANPGSLGSGMYSGTVTVTQASLLNSPLTIPVTLIVNGGTGGGGGGNGSLTLSPTVLTFNAAVNGSSPSGQAISVTASSATNFNITTATTSGGSWLTASQSAGITPANITMFANSNGLGLGTYNGSVTFSANGLNQIVSVVLNVTSSGTGGGNVSLDRGSLSFTAQAGTSGTSPQTINVSSTTGSAISVTTSASTTSGGNWLTVTSSGTTTPIVITVSVSAAALSGGTYNGSIQVTPTGGSTVTVPVTLTVSSPPTVSASPTSLTFTYRAGDAAPATQNISVTGGTSLTFTATTSSSLNWLSVSPVLGQTPATLTVSVSPSSLNASPTPYTGTITVAGTGGASGSTTITVSLTVTAPLPTISKVTNAGSFVTSTAVSPGEIITLFASDAQHPIGPSTAVGLALDSTGKVATTLGGVQVLAGGFPCPLTYVSATQISAAVPYELAGFAFSGADIFVKFLGQSSNAIHVNVATTQPGLFTQNSSGTGPGAILNSNGSVNSPSNPTTKGDIVVVYMTGEGQTTPAGVTGKVTTAGPGPQFTPAPLLPISILLISPTGAQQAANYIYAGEAPNFISGAMQLNVQIPTTATSGDQQIIVAVGPNSSQQGVTVSIR